MLRRNSQLLGLALAIAAFVLVGLALARPDAGSEPPYASSNAHPSGVKGLFTLLEEQHVPVRAWKKPWTALPDTDGQALIVIEPRGLGAAEVETIREWAEAGNEVLVLEDDPWQWEDFALTEAAAGIDGDAGLAEAGGAVPVPIRIVAGHSSGETLSGAIASPYRLKPDEKLEPLLADERGIVAGRIAYGSGSVTMLLVPEWASNGRIMQWSHFELLWPQLPLAAQAVWFDDYHHGLQQLPGMLSVYPAWLLAVLLQLSFGVLLWLWQKAVRFGPAYEPREWTVRRGDETLLAAAGWYDRRKLTREAIGHQARYIRSLLRQRWGVPLQATEQQVLAAARRRWSAREAEELAALLQRLREAERQPAYPVKQLVQDSRLADPIIRKLEKE